MVILYVQVNIFQSCQDNFLSSWVKIEPVFIKQQIKHLAQGHNTVTLVHAPIKKVLSEGVQL